MKEVDGLMAALGMHLSESEGEVIMKEFDKSGDGTINFEEFWSYMRARTAPVDTHKVVSDVFSMLDKDGSNTITSTEFADILHSLPVKISDPDIEALITEMDSGGDGEIDLHEFAAVLEKYK
jgi:Ca2+-binding EF-hand superfamily protein